MRPSVPEDLRAKAAIYEERNAIYGDNYKLFGSAVMPMFQNGVSLETPTDMSRFGVLVQILAKVTRYCNMFNRGGHDDSLDDIAVYAMMLKELDNEAREAENQSTPPPFPEHLTDDDLDEFTRELNNEKRLVPRRIDPGGSFVGQGSIGAGQPEVPPSITHYVHFNGASHFVKDANLFTVQKGHEESWGKKWRPVIADSMQHALELSRDLPWDQTEDRR